MRNLLKVLATFFLLILFAGCLKMFFVNSDLANHIPSFGSGKMGGIGFLLGFDGETLCTVVGFGWAMMAKMAAWGIVSAFIKQRKYGFVLSIMLFVMTFLLVMLQPSAIAVYGQNPRPMGLIVAFLGLCGIIPLLILCKPKPKPANPDDIARAL